MILGNQPQQHHVLHKARTSYITVRYLMEEMIPELEDYEKKGYFSRSEIKQIVQKRQDFEYLLKRRAALKQDFYRYIDYETKLEELRKHRKKERGIKGKKSLAEHSVVRRIHFIYERAARKFKSDLQLWKRWIQFCKDSKSTKQLSKVVTKALQRHATMAAFWIEAAAWEFEHNSNVAAARSLMQQGLRMCKNDENMWVEYFRMELLYVHKLRARREALGIDNYDESSAGGEETQAAVQAVLSGAVAQVVYKNAVTALPQEVRVRQRFLKVLRPFDFPGVNKLTDAIYDSIARDFPSSEEAWDVRARRHQPPALPDASPAPWDADSHTQVCQVYQQALQSTPTPRMHELHCNYLAQQAEALMADPEQLDTAAEVAAQLLAAYHAAHAAKLASDTLYISWITWARKLEQNQIALTAARKGCEAHPASAALWHQRLELELQLTAQHSLSSSELWRTFKAALSALTAAEAVGIWLQALQAVQESPSEFGELCALLVQQVSRGPHGPLHGGLGHVAAAVTQKIRDVQGLAAARTFYEQLLHLPAPGADFFRCIIQIEREHYHSEAHDPATLLLHKCKAKATGVHDGPQRITRLYEAALRVYGGEATDMWLDYALFMQQHGQGAGQVYWKAVKALTEPDDFIQQYRQALQVEGS